MKKVVWLAVAFSLYACTTNQKMTTVEVLSQKNGIISNYKDNDSIEILKSKYPNLEVSKVSEIGKNRQNEFKHYKEAIAYFDSIKKNQPVMTVESMLQKTKNKKDYR